MVQPLSTRTLTPGAIVAGKYVIASEIGRGGMGAVYRAHHRALDQFVAIKVLFGQSTAEVARFAREARSAARLHSGHVVRVSDVGHDEGVGPYMVMELLDGADLGRLVDQQGPLPIAFAVDAILQAIDALAEAHAHGIVHRDLKPQNLFLATRADGSTIVKVLDFGISKAAGFDDATQKLTETRALIGSPHYMSPEQLRSAHDVDGRADVWSLGVLLYELLTTKTPFVGHTVGAVFASILESTPTGVRAHRPEVPAGVESAIGRCIQRDPAQRYQHVGELALDLAPFGSGREAPCVARAVAFATRAGSRVPSSSGTLPALMVTPNPSGAAWTPSPQATPPARPLPTPVPGAGASRARAGMALAVAITLLAAIVGVVLGVRGRGKGGSAARPEVAASATVARANDDLASPATPVLAADPPPTGAPPASASAPPAASATSLAVRPKPSPRPSASAPAVSSPDPPSAEPDLDRRR